MPTAPSPSASTRRRARSPSPFPRPPATRASRSTRNRLNAAAARRAVLGGATWQRCRSSGKRSPGSFSAPPHHLAQNAIHHAPNADIRKRIGAELRAVWNASTLAKAETALAELVASYRETAPKLAAWLEENVPQGLAVFALPEHHRRRMRTSNPMERVLRYD